MKRNGIWLLLSGAILLAVVGVMLYFNQTEEADRSQSEQPVSSEEASETVNEPAESDNSEGMINDGRYTDYDADVVAAVGYETTILFFHAEWCPECRAFDEALMESDVPDGVQLLKVDYDANQDLRKKYDVTTQTTFVRVDARGEKQSAWVGYGRDKSLSAILENTT